MGFKIAEAFVEVKADSTGLREEVDAKVKEASLGQKILVGLGFDEKSLKASNLGGLMANLAPFILPAVGALGQLTGVLGLVPAAGAAAGTAYGALKVGISGFGDALKKADAAKNTQELNDALADLAPSARESALAVHNLEPAWNNLHLDVQQRLFQGVGKDIQRLGIVDLPVLRRGLDQTASALNQGVHYFTAWATSSKTVGDLRTIFDNTGVSTQNLMRSLQPVLSIVRDLATVGSQFLPKLTSGFAGAAQRAADFVSNARETGKLREWIQTGIDATGQLFHILGNLVQIIIKIGQSPPLFGLTFLSALSSVTGLILKLVTTFPELLPLIEAGLVLWRAWAIAQWAVNAAMEANPIGLVITAIGALVVATVLIVNHWQAVKDFLNATWSWIRDNAMAIFNGVRDYLAGLWKSIYDNVAGVLNSIRDFFVNIWNAISSVTHTVWDAIFGYLGRLWQAHKDLVMPIFNSIRDFLAGIWNSIRDTTITVWNAIVAFLTPALNAFRSFFEGVWNAIRDFFVGVWNSISSTATNVWNSINGFLTGAMNGFRGYFSGVWNGIVGDFQNIWGRITGIAQGIWNDVINAFRAGINAVIGLANRFVIDDIDAILKFFLIPTIPAIPLLASGGTVGGGFQTNGPMAIVGEGNPSHPEYVIPTDPAHRGNALALYQSLGAKLMASGGILGAVDSWISGGANALNGIIDQLVSGMQAGVYRNIAAGLGHKMVGGVQALVDKAMQSFAAAFHGSPDLAGWIQTAIGLTGVPQSWAGPLSVLIGRESGGNPNAINLTDSNAAAGHPSQGLMQTIPSTFNAYHQPGTSWNINDPVANIAAGINYIKARYGSIFNVQQANPNLPPKGYDSGGMLPPGLSTVYNGTGRPEPVLTPQQLNGLLGAGSRPVVNNFNVTIDAKSVAEMQSVTQFFHRVQQVARATTASAGRVA